MNNIPILLIIYNRPNNFKKLIKKLKIIKSKKIYIFADGPNKLKTNSNFSPQELNTLTKDIATECLHELKALGKDKRYKFLIQCT